MDSSLLRPPGWTRREFRTLGTWYSGGTPGRDTQSFWNGGIPWVSPKDMKLPRITETIDHVTQSAVEAGARIVPAGSVLIVIRGMILARAFPVAVSQRPVAFNQDMKALVPSPECDAEFLLYWLAAAERTVLRFVKNSTHGTLALPMDQLLSQSIDLPPLEEQRAIASILRSADNAIEATGKVAAATRRVKAGIADQLLSGRKRGPSADTDGPDSLPRGWIRTNVGALFSHRVEPGKDNLPVMAVTMDRGLVARETLDRRVESELSPARHLRVRPGDLAYNTMRMWQGVSGVAQCDCMISPAYVVCSPTPLILPRFAAHFFKWGKMIDKLRHYSQGLTEDRLRLYFHHFARIPIAIPPIDEQVSIAATLDSMDAELLAVEEQAKALFGVKRALLQDLLTGRVRAKEGVGLS